MAVFTKKTLILQNDRTNRTDSHILAMQKDCLYAVVEKDLFLKNAGGFSWCVLDKQNNPSTHARGRRSVNSHEIDELGFRSKRVIDPPADEHVLEDWSARSHFSSVQQTTEFQTGRCVYQQIDSNGNENYL